MPNEPTEPIEMQLKALFRGPASDADRVHAIEEEYANWRRQSAAVAESYRSFTRAPRDRRWLAHAAYLTALDCEEDAARAYRRTVEEVMGRR